MYGAPLGDAHEHVVDSFVAPRLNPAIPNEAGTPDRFADNLGGSITSPHDGQDTPTLRAGRQGSPDGLRCLGTEDLRSRISKFVILIQSSAKGNHEAGLARTVRSGPRECSLTRLTDVLSHRLEDSSGGPRTDKTLQSRRIGEVRVDPDRPAEATVYVDTTGQCVHAAPSSRYEPL